LSSNRERRSPEFFIAGGQVNPDITAQTISGSVLDQARVLTRLAPLAIQCRRPSA